MVADTLKPFLKRNLSEKLVVNSILKTKLVDTGINFLQGQDLAWLVEGNVRAPKCWSVTDELSNVSVLRPPEVSTCINDVLRV